MPAATKQDSAVGSYAQAILDLANERQETETIAGELRGLKDLLASNPALEAYLRDPAISQDERQDFLDRVLRGRISPLLMNSLAVMNQKGRLGLLADVADQYQVLLDRQLGKIEVKAIVAREMEPELLQEVAQRISAALQKKATVRQVVDESIIGGMIVQVEDRLIDASVQTQLQTIRKQMLAAIPK
ncbi:MAG TPA: ATP synthase F1 subunit delta [Tepidisphaeraceae bacterium]|nr:ATP synthase F1 subunit delta [Tepidisphaeraceae bacterium]